MPMERKRPAAEKRRGLHKKKKLQPLDPATEESDSEEHDGGKFVAPIQTHARSSRRSRKGKETTQPEQPMEATDMHINDSSDEDEFDTTDESDQEEETTWSPTSKMLMKTLTKKSEPPIFKGYNYIDWEKAVKQGMEFCKLTKDKHMLTYAKAYMSPEINQIVKSLEAEKGGTFKTFKSFSTACREAFVDDNYELDLRTDLLQMRYKEGTNVRKYGQLFVVKAHGLRDTDELMKIAILLNGLPPELAAKVRDSGAHNTLSQTVATLTSKVENSNRGRGRTTEGHGKQFLNKKHNRPDHRPNTTKAPTHGMGRRAGPTQRTWKPMCRFGAACNSKVSCPKFHPRSFPNKKVQEN